MQVGVDTGGTFTDVVDAAGRSTKVLTTPADPAEALRAGVAALGGVAPRADGDVFDPSLPASARPRPAPAFLAHGTTVATNALLERRLARVALVTTSGLADVIEIARQDRPSLYDQLASRPEPLVPRAWRYEVVGRLAADGTELVPLDVGSLGALDPAIEAVAVCLLHADLNPAHEQAVAAALPAGMAAGLPAGLEVSCSHEVSPEMREYERTVTTVINAGLRPRVRSYLGSLADVAGAVFVMTSAGGLLPVEQAAVLPAALLLSGPAGGVRAGAAVAAANGFPDAVTFDMGGTSTDVCLVLAGAPAPAAQRQVGGFTVRFPALDIHTIGAGGGSIAALDAGGALVVGPRSAGADPGPACYGRGGVEPTVTDADLVAGRIPGGVAFGGLQLDLSAAVSALDAAGVTAEGVIAVVDANMERAVRVVSVERGVDPRGLALVAFGGAGPLHAVAIAEALGMAAVIVPDRAGVLSAVGLLTAPRRRDLVRSWPTPSDHDGLASALSALAEEARELVTDPDADPDDVADVDGGVSVVTELDCRYAGQSHELRVPSVSDFHAEHRRRNGYARPEQPVEVIALRATAQRPAAVEMADLPPAGRRLSGRVVGPQVLAEPDCTIWIPEGWEADAGVAGAIVLRRSGVR